MKRLNGYFREEGLYTFVRWHTFFTNPPLCITEEQLRDGLRDHRSLAGEAGGVDVAGLQGCGRAK